MIRVVSATVLIVVVGSTVFLLPPWATLVLASVAAAAAAAELAGLARALGARVPPMFAAVAAGATAWVGIGYAALWFVEFLDAELIWASVSATAGGALILLHRDWA